MVYTVISGSVRWLSKAFFYVFRIIVNGIFAEDDSICDCEPVFIGWLAVGLEEGVPDSLSTRMNPMSMEEFDDFLNTFADPQ